MRGIAPLKIDVKHGPAERKTFNRFFCEENSMIRTNSREWRDWEFFNSIEIRSIEYWAGHVYGHGNRPMIDFGVEGELKSVMDTL